MKYVDKNVAGQLDLDPAKLFFKRYFSPKYIKPDNCELLNCKGDIADLTIFLLEHAKRMGLLLLSGSKKCTSLKFEFSSSNTRLN